LLYNLGSTPYGSMKRRNQHGFKKTNKEEKETRCSKNG